MPLAAAATFVGATLQSATGFGFALVLGPAIFAVLEPEEALTTLLVLGVSLNLFMLTAERRPLQIRRGELTWLLIAAAPGLVAGALILRALPRQSLQLAVGVAVLAAAAFHASQARTTRAGSGVDSRLAAGVGIASGLLTTTTSTNGPPLVLWLQRMGLSPAELRDSITAALLPLNLLGAVTLVVIGGQRQALDAASVIPLLAFTVAGAVAGRLLFERLDPGRFQTIGLVLVAAAGIGSIVGAIAG